MTRRKSLLIVAVILAIALLVALGIPSLLNRRKVSQENACLNNMRLLHAAAMSSCLESGRSYGDTIKQEEVAAYLYKHMQCLSGNLPYPPFNCYEGPQCPNGHMLPKFDGPERPWDGTFREYLTALQQDIRPMGMRLGASALNRLTPQMFQSEAVRKFILFRLEEWYKNPFNTDLIACAAGALGRIRDKRAVETLIKGLACEEWYARMKITEALELIGDKRAIEPLKPLLEDKNERVKKTAAQALKKLQAD